LVTESFESRYYDPAGRRLVYIGNRATPENWDKLWMSDADTVRNAVKPVRGTKWLVRLTRRFLSPRDGRILEGGCGPGQNVAALQREGYQITGVDYAAETVAAVTRAAPELQVILGDLRSLPFANESFAGYWSLGVIEHFYTGFGDLAREMARILRPDGYLFLTFPYMSPLRRLRARFLRYPNLQAADEPAGFYQFALNAALVADEFKTFGFRKRYQTSMSGLQGLKDEVGVLHTPLQSLHDYAGRSLLVRGFRFFMETAAPLGAGHSCVMVLQKNGRG
jgi:SAM-dependent methyltransferase